MVVAAISAIGPAYVSAPVAAVRAAASSQAAAVSTTQTVNFGPAVQVQLSAQAQSLLAASSNSQTPSQASLALTYQSTAERVWAQVLASLDITQQQLDTMSATQRNETEARAAALAEVRMDQQIVPPNGISQGVETRAIVAAINAVTSA